MTLQQIMPISDWASAGAKSEWNFGGYKVIVPSICGSSTLLKNMQDPCYGLLFAIVALLLSRVHTSDLVPRIPIDIYFNLIMSLVEALFSRDSLDIAFGGVAVFQAVVAVQIGLVHYMARRSGNSQGPKLIMVFFSVAETLWLLCILSAVRANWPERDATRRS